jgi:hypothetical protein
MDTQRRRQSERGGRRYRPDAPFLCSDGETISKVLNRRGNGGL